MKKGTVLVFDDDKLSMRLMRSILERGNYNVLEALSAKEGLEIVKNSHPDIILMDVHIPDLDGIETTKIIKSDPELKEIPIIALSGAVMQEDEEQAIEAGCVGYMSKPIDVHSLIDTMEKLLE